MDLFMAPRYKTINKGKTASDLIAAATIIKTMSNDYIIRVGSYDLGLTDDHDLAVSDYGTTVCIMTIDDVDYDALAALETQCARNYQTDQLNQ